MHSRPTTAFDIQLEAHEKYFQTKQEHVLKNQEKAESKVHGIEDIESVQDGQGLVNDKYKDDEDEIETVKMVTEPIKVAAVKVEKVDAIGTIISAIKQFHQEDLDNNMYATVRGLKSRVDSIKMKEVSGTANVFISLFQKTMRYNETQTQLDALQKECAQRFANCDKVFEIRKIVTAAIDKMEGKSGKKAHVEKIKVLQAVRLKIDELSKEGKQKERLVNPGNVQILLETIYREAEKSPDIKKNVHKDGTLTIQNTGGDTTGCLLEMIAILQKEQQYYLVPKAGVEHKRST